jgi:hypothetical protein
LDSGELPGKVQTARLSVASPDGRPHGYVNVKEVKIRRTSSAMPVGGHAPVTCFVVNADVKPISAATE